MGAILSFIGDIFAAIATSLLQQTKQGEEHDDEL